MFAYHLVIIISTDTADILTTDIEEQLQEGIIRTGSALVFGARAKQEGDKVVRAAQSSRDKFNRASKEQELEKKVELLAAGLNDLSVSIIYLRMMLGNMTSINVTSALFGDKGNKLITKIQKGLKIR